MNNDNIELPDISSLSLNEGAPRTVDVNRGTSLDLVVGSLRALTLSSSKSPVDVLVWNFGDTNIYATIGQTAFSFSALHTGLNQWERAQRLVRQGSIIRVKWDASSPDDSGVAISPDSLVFYRNDEQFIHRHSPASITTLLDQIVARVAQMWRCAGY
jgi:hypothetical protein